MSLENALLIGTNEAKGATPGRGDWYYERLYRTVDGKYVLDGMGETNTKYRNRGFAREISEAAAKTWCLYNIPAEHYYFLFGRYDRMMEINRQSPQEMLRETFGTICHAANDLAREAENQSATGVQVQFDFLKTQVQRMNTIRKDVLNAKKGL